MEALIEAPDEPPVYYAGCATVARHSPPLRSQYRPPMNFLVPAAKDNGRRSAAPP